ncbi:signal peptide peptidase-like 2B [Monoraphidium neglectum]|uniref:Signal peptide peptidase-like 2B n=1 Tax=Monoraphidium neglectum TaxID=145388 RepID=A0A0D2MLL4_9CHLO|nr:signal peptide peptidase-like 2B [Monoraphidium neglectum]KIY95705.1 signal peptide peptidase-like 2B [Monoraphidium neglectum]|eukprot:XP_013894725.1 signal peptide peptidase-like 2B [Monoraphidium neglectum]
MWAIVVGALVVAVGARAEDICEGPVVELQLESQDGSFVETEYGVVGAFGTIPSLNGSRPVRLVAAEPLDACGPLEQQLEGAVAVARRGACSFVAKYLAVLAAGGSALLMFNDAPEPGDQKVNGTIPAISIDHDLGAKLVNLTRAGPVVLISVALLDLPPLDAGAALLWLMAVLTVAGGALWSGRDHAEGVKAAAAAGGDADAARRARERGGAGGPAGGALDVTAAGAVAFVGVASAMLLLLYFFMDKAFFYFILGVFTITSAQAMGVALAAAVAAAAPALAARDALVPFIGPVPLPALIAAPPSLATAAVWAAFRGAAWSWPLLDALGICLMLLVLRTLRLGSLRVACVLLPLCFLYDVFFVFIQPLLFGGGESVMVEVARGAGADEVMPMLLRVPRLQGPPIARGGYSMLGFGDIILPGLLVALMRRVDIDLRLPWPRGYFLPALAGYGPALLYLVPCTLGTVLALTAARGDLRRLWAEDSSSGGGGGWALLLQEEPEPGPAQQQQRGAGTGAGAAAWRAGGGEGWPGGAGGGGGARHSPTGSSTRLLSRGGSQLGGAV